MSHISLLTISWICSTVWHAYQSQNHNRLYNNIGAFQRFSQYFRSFSSVYWEIAYQRYTFFLSFSKTCLRVLLSSFPSSFPKIVSKIFQLKRKIYFSKIILLYSCIIFFFSVIHVVAAAEVLNRTPPLKPVLLITRQQWNFPKIVYVGRWNLQHV